MILRQALILSAKREYVQAMREALLLLGDEATRIDVEMDALRAMQLAPRQYDLIVLDAVMEAMDGLQLLLLMKLQAPTTQFVVVSDNPATEVRDLALQNGADFYLLRPGAPTAFQNAARNIGTILQQAQVNRTPEGAQEPLQNLADTVQKLCRAGDSVILLVKAQVQSGDIFIYRGDVYHAQYPGKSGPAAFHEMCHWDNGLVRVRIFRLTNIPPRTIETPYPELVKSTQTGPLPEPDLKPPPLPTTESGGFPLDPAQAMEEAPPLAGDLEPASPFLIDPINPEEAPMPQVDSYWKISLMGELVEGSRVADADRSALITTFIFRKMADVAVALEVDYFDTLVLIGPREQQVLVADNLGVRHAVLGPEHATEKTRGQFVEWCREQSL